MNKNISIYLDLLRTCAAFTVVLAHFSDDFFSADYFDFFFQFRHAAVMVFFVLSGYVIAFVADTKEANLKEYFISRFSRLYSVVLPALILIPMLDYTGIYFDSTIYDGKMADSYYFIRVLSNISFSQEFWYFRIRYLSAGPLWSLGYEFWYYVLFAFSFYVKGYRKYIYILFISLLVGPKILLLLPVWAIGVGIYFFHKNKHLNIYIARSLFFLTPCIFLYIFYFYTDINEILYLYLGAIDKDELGFSQSFFTDYITGIIFGIHLLATKYVYFNFMDRILFFMEKSIRNLADRTFTLYVMHFTFFLFYAAILEHDNESVFDAFILLALTVISCFLLSEITEMRKYVFKKYIKVFSDKFESVTIK